MILYTLSSLYPVVPMISQLHLISVVEFLLPPYGLVVEVNSNGQIVRSFHDQGGHVSASASHVLDLGDTLLVGSYHAPYLVKLDLS